MSYFKRLYNASANGDTETLEALLQLPEARANVAARRNKVLQVAVRNGHIEVVDRLLRITEVVEYVDMMDETVEQALRYPDIVSRLLEVPQFAAVASNKANRALRWAAQIGSFETVKKLLEIPEVYNNAAVRGNEALRFAIGYGCLDIVNILLEVSAVSASVEAGVFTVGLLLPGIQHPAVFERLLEFRGVRANAAVEDNFILQVAIAEGRWDVVTRLLDIPVVRQGTASVVRRLMGDNEQAAANKLCNLISGRKDGLCFLNSVGRYDYTGSLRWLYQQKGPDQGICSERPAIEVLSNIAGYAGYDHEEFDVREEDYAAADRGYRIGG